MTVEVLRSFFMWCTIINVAIMLVMFVFCTVGRDWMYKMHGGMFSLSREAFDVVIYSYLGLYKVLVLVFNVVPFLALLIVG